MLSVNFVLAVLLATGRASLTNAMEAAARDARATITNLAQLRQSAEQKPLTVRPIHIVADVYDADPACNALVLRDSTGIEFIKFMVECSKIEPGTKIRLEGSGCGVTRQSFGLLIIPGLVVDNDGIHPSTLESGKVYLQRGLNPFVLQVFNRWSEFNLDLEYEGPGIARQRIPSSSFYRLYVDPSSGETNFTLGLNYRYYEGFWSHLPNFPKLKPIKSGVTTNIDIGVRLRNEGIAIEFNGFLKVPRDGIYTFNLTSDDGSRLYVGNASLQLHVLPNTNNSNHEMETKRGTIDEEAYERWVTIEGIVGFAGSRADGGEMTLQMGTHEIRVEIFDNCGFTPTFTPHTRVRVSGLYRNLITENGSRIPGIVRVTTWGCVQPIPASWAQTPPKADTLRTILGPENATMTNASLNPITTIAGVKELSPEAAAQQLPVRIRGVGTAIFHSYINAAIVHDFTRGVFVSLQGTELSEPVRRGELYEIEGVTSPGDFAPVIVAKRIKHLGTGKLPEPIKPALNQLLSGAIDTEYIELEGFVVAIRGQEIDMLTVDGEIPLILDDFQPEELAVYENALVRIRGCAMAIFETQTRQLTPGSVRIVSGAIDVVQSAQEDLFAIPEKKISELLLYDPKATPIKLIKVEGQIIYAGKHGYFLTDGTNSISASLRNANEHVFKPGDLVEAVGFLDWSGPTPGLKKALMRKIGHAPTHVPITPDSENLLSRNYAGKLVKLKGRMINAWYDGSEYNLELQSGFVGFKARLAELSKELPRLRTGSLLELTGVYVPHSSSPHDRTVTGFELLMHSPTCIRVLANPPWLTLKRALYAVAILVTLLVGVLVWSLELHKKVQERTQRLESEMRKRQRAELQHAAEMERSRIARDLHDELGAGLTAISLLASVGLPNLESGHTMNRRFTAIANKARALVEALDVIVWAVDPKRDSLQSFADYVASHAKEFFDASGIVCRLKIPIECDGITLRGPVRHGLFLAVKEALNNIIRHAAANEVELVISLLPNHLEIAIKDNGRGFDRNSTQLGNGLRNLQNRLAGLGGECIIDSQPGKGTTVKLAVPLDESASNQS